MIITSPELSNIRDSASDQTIALRFGCYDILHAGHQAGIDFAKAQADLLVVGVMPDSYVTKQKGPERPINSEERRLAAIDEAEGVDFSFIANSSSLTVAQHIIKLNPDVYVEEAEHSRGKLKSSFLYLAGVRYILDEQTRIGSTSSMIANLGLVTASSNSSLTYSAQ